MPLNSQIPLMTHGVDASGAISAGANQANQLMRFAEEKKQAPIRNRLLDLQVGNAEGVSRQQQGREAVLDAVPINASLQRKDNAGALALIDQRIQKLTSQGRDPSDSIAFRERLINNPDQAALEIADIISMGQQTGVLKVSDNKLFTTTKVAEDGTLIGINTDAGTAATIDTGGATFKGSAPTVNINNEAQNKGLTEEQKALGKSRVKRFEGLQEAADNAIDQDEQLAQLEGMDVETGFGVDTRSLIASAVNAVAGAGSGDALLDVNLPAIQAFKSVSKRMVNSELNKAKGPQTEGDARRAEKTVASLGNEMLANKFIIKSLRATNARKIEQSEFYQQVLERDGTLKNADKEWAAFKRKTPMLSATVMDRETGLPMFFNEFRAKTLERNPQATVDQIINAWREMQ